jgi:hypothetical protein
MTRLFPGAGHPFDAAVRFGGAARAAAGTGQGETLSRRISVMIGKTFMLAFFSILSEKGATFSGIHWEPPPGDPP